MIKITCIHCSQTIDAPDEMSGIDANCPTCGGPIKVPENLVLQEDVDINTSDDFHPSPNNDTGYLEDSNLDSKITDINIKKYIFAKIKSSYYTKISILAFCVLLFANFFAPLAKSNPNVELSPQHILASFLLSLMELAAYAIPSILVTFIVFYTIKLISKKTFLILNLIIYGVPVISLSIVNSIATWQRWDRYHEEIREIRVNANKAFLRIGATLPKSTTDSRRSPEFEWVRQNLFGVSILLPKKPTISKVSMPIETRELIKGGYYDQAMIKTSQFEIVFTRMDRVEDNINLNEIIRGTVSDIENHHLISNVKVNIFDEIKISDYRALWTEASYVINQQEWCTRYLVFNEGPTLWMLGMTSKEKSNEYEWDKITRNMEVSRN